MNIKIVKNPLQTSDTELEELEFVEFVTEDNQIKRIVPNWCVKTHMYAEVDGGMKLWFEYLKELEIKGCKTVYLFDIKAVNEKIVNGFNENDWIKTIIYFVRADYKT